MDKPEFIYRNGISVNDDYVKWLADVKKRFVSAQAKAMVKVNSSLLELYWSIGRDLQLLKMDMIEEEGEIRYKVYRIKKHE